MRCEEYQRTIIAYALGDTSDVSDPSGLDAHLRSCESCRALHDSYRQLVSAVAGDPAPSPTASESEALARALAEVCPVAKPTAEPLPRNLPALVWASVLAFVVIATGLALQVLGRIDLAAAFWSIGPARIALGAVIAIIITSFLPIAVTARRRPLNGMTFSR